MLKDNFGDWRIAIVTTLAQDQPSAYPGGPSPKAGAPVYVSSLIKNKQHGLVGFVSPHPTALALSLAIKFASSSRELKSRISIKDSITPFGNGKLVSDQDMVLLFDFFESCMVTITFSFQAVEAYANSVISDFPDKKIKVKRKKDIVEMDSADAERALSTEEKLAQALPFLLNIPSPSGKKHWIGFKQMKGIRDSIVHFKSKDISTKYKVDTDSLYYHFFATDMFKHVASAGEMVRCFLPKQDYPRWFVGFEELLKTQSSSFP